MWIPGLQIRQTIRSVDCPAVAMRNATIPLWKIAFYMTQVFPATLFDDMKPACRREYSFVNQEAYVER